MNTGVALDFDLPFGVNGHNKLLKPLYNCNILPLSHFLDKLMKLNELWDVGLPE